MSKNISAGFRYIFYGTVNASGYLIGNTADGATAGDTSGQAMLRLEGAQTAPIAVTENETVDVLGDDEPLTQFGFEGGTLPSGVIEMAVRDTTFEALAQGTTNQTIGTIEVGALQPGSPNFQEFFLLLQRRSKNWAAGSRGAKRWEGIIVRCTVSPLFSEFQQRTNTPYRYSIQTSKFDRSPWGATFIEAVNGTETMAILPFLNTYPLHVHAFQGDGAETGFTVAYTPKSGGTLRVYVDGYVKTLTTDYTVSGSTVTFVAAPSDGAVINILYDVDDSDLV